MAAVDGAGAGSTARFVIWPLAWPIVLLYHLYAGVAGLIQFTPVGQFLVSLFDPIMTAYTFPVLIVIVSALARSRERMPANASLTSTAVTPGSPVQAGERPGAPRRAASRRRSARRGA